MRFFMLDRFLLPCSFRSRAEGNMTKLEGGSQCHAVMPAVMPALRDRAPAVLSMIFSRGKPLHAFPDHALDITAREYEGIFAGRAPLLFRALPDHAWEALQRHQRFAGISPFLQFIDCDVIERLPARAFGEQSARDVHHVRRARALVN